MKYLVMECHAGYAVLMDEASRFVRAANLHYEIGQTVTDPVLMTETQPRIRRSTVIRIAAAAACLLLLSGAGLHAYLSKHRASSSVRLCSEVEFEMQLNSAGEVIRISSSTESGQAMLDSYRPDQKDMLAVVSELLTMQREQGYLPEGETVSIYIDSKDEKKFEEYKTGLEAELPKLNLQVSVQEQTLDTPAEAVTPAGEPDKEPPEVEPPKPGREHDGPAEALHTDHTRPEPPVPPAESAVTGTRPHGPGSARKTEAGSSVTLPEPENGSKPEPEVPGQQVIAPDDPAARDPEGPLPPNTHPEPAGPPPPPAFDDEPAAEHTAPAAPPEPEAAGTEVPAPEVPDETAPHPELREEPSLPELHEEPSLPEAPAPRPETPLLNSQASEPPRV